MKTLVIYYSYGGSTRRYAMQLAKETDATLAEVDYKKRPGMLRAFFNCPAAVRQKPAKDIVMNPAKLDFDSFDAIVVMGPIWASHPAPPVNNIIGMLPAGKKVELRFCSSGGQSEKAKVTALVEARGCTVTGYTDIKVQKAK